MEAIGFFLRFILALLFLCAGAVGAIPAPQEWPPVTEAEYALKECPGQPGAPAVYLYREQTSDANEWTFKVFNRLKILSPSGRDYANIEIPFSEAWRVKTIEARVVQPDGRIQPFTDEIFEKTIVQVGRLKRSVKTLVMPDVDVGCIIDYRYELKFDPKRASKARSLKLERWKPEEGGLPVDLRLFSYIVELWDLNAPLYTRKAKYTYIPFRRGLVTFADFSLSLAWVSYGLLWGPPILKEDRIELEVDAIPAFEEEELMAPEETGRMGVIFFLCDTNITDAADYWRRESENWQKSVERFLAATGSAEAECRDLVAGASGSLERLRPLYERAQRIRNRSYDSSMTFQRKRELKIKENRNVADVLKSNTGLRSDIARTFVALARAAGFSADVARVVTRDDKFFHEKILDLYGQFDSEVAVVTVGGREMFFDPGTPYCPMGLVRWNATDTSFIRTSGEPGRFYMTPLDPPEKSAVRREYALQMDPQGNVNGVVRVIYTGQEALTLRLEHHGNDELQTRESLEAKMKALLPGYAGVSLRKVENMSNSEEAVHVEFDIAVRDLATVAGDRLLLATMPFRGRWHNFPRHARRKSSVYFGYLSRESDDIVISLPVGFRVEAMPAAGQSKRSFSEYSLTTAIPEEGQLHIRRELMIGKTQVAADVYPALKSFFDQVRSSDAGRIVLAPEKNRPRVAEAADPTVSPFFTRTGGMAIIRAR